MNFDSIFQLVSELGATGLVFWLMHRIFTKTIPDLTKSFEKSLERIQISFDKAIESKREDHKQLIKTIEDLIKAIDKD